MKLWVQEEVQQSSKAKENAKAPQTQQLTGRKKLFNSPNNFWESTQNPHPHPDPHPDPRPDPYADPFSPEPTEG